jgi:hypothetical protein
MGSVVRGVPARDRYNSSPTDTPSVCQNQRYVQGYQGAAEERAASHEGPPSMRVAVERIARLTVENERLKKENSALLEQFVVWQYNAHVRGLNDIDLNQPLLEVDRGNTEEW